MGKFIIGASLIVVGVVAWRMGETLNRDAIAMALGVFFGMVAGIPIALLVAANRCPQDDETAIRAKLRAEVEQELCAEIEQYRLTVRPTAWRVVANDRQIGGGNVR